jgi:hypothetical protein
MHVYQEYIKLLMCMYLADMLQDGHHIGFMVTNPLLSIITHVQLHMYVILQLIFK